MRLCLPDSDTVNYLLKKVVSVTDRYEAAIYAGTEFVLCPVVDYEVRRYLFLKGMTRRLRLYEELVAEWDRGELEAADWEQAARLWAEHHRLGRSITDSDLLIAVTALKRGAVLVTNNVSHFEGLAVVLENWVPAE